MVDKNIKHEGNPGFLKGQLERYEKYLKNL